VLALSVHRQNPVISLLKIPVKYVDEQICDFVVGSERSHVIFLQYTFHLRNRNFFETKQLLPNSFLLLYLDSQEEHDALMEINLKCFNNNMRILCAFSLLDAARILEALHTYSRVRAMEICRGSNVGDIEAKIKDALSTIRGVNSTDVTNLMKRFGCIKKIACASIEDLIGINGIGEKKAKNIYRCFNDPLRL
jgi:ERCC4-type nuclease